MADKKDNPPSKETAKPELTTSDSLEKPLLDEQSSEETADIDTSHLTLDESAGQPSGALESERELDAPAINTSYLSLQEEDSVKPTNKPDDELSPGNDETAAGSSSEESIDYITLSTDEPVSVQEQPATQNSLAQKTPEATASSPSEEVAEAPAKKEDAEQVMLTTGISDAEFDEEMQATTAKASADEDPEDDEDEHPEGPIKSILDTVKKPENIVQNAWSNSSARRFLIDNIESLRVKDEDQNMESVLEKMYGGVVEKKFAPGKFLKENLLFSFLLFIFLFLVGWKAAGIFFPDFMPAINDQIIETVKKTTSRKGAVKTDEKKKPIVTDIANKEKIDEVLSHCLVEPDARIAFASAFTSVGYKFTDRSLTLSYDEIHDSIRVWKNMDMEFYTRDAIFRFRELAKLALPITENANKAVSDYNQSLLRIKQKANTLDERIRNIQTRGGNQSTDTINERIPLRNKLDKINARLADEPDQMMFDQLLKKLTVVENILAGREMPARVEPDQLTEKDPDWLMSTAETASSDIATPIIAKTLPAIQTPADKLKKANPKLTTFHLSELENALDDLLKLTALIIYLPENRLISYKLELSGLNRRLNKTMKKELSAWMNFDRCLANGRAEVPAVSE